MILPEGQDAVPAVLVVLLPLVAAQLVLLAASWARPWRRAVMVGMVLWGCVLAGITELLGSVERLAAVDLAVAWALVAVACAVMMAKRRASLPRLNPRRLSLPTARLERACLVVVVVLLALTGIAALVSPPNSWDVMDYHLPRVIQWIERRGLAYHPVHYYPQLFYPPLAEWVILHLRLLSGTDRLSNLVQWTSFAGCIVGVSYAAALIGVGRRGQWLAAALCAVLPQAVLAASGSKNDLVACSWLLGSAVFVLRFAREEKPGDAVFAGLALGLSLLTKGTGFYFAPALLVGCAVPCLRRLRWRSLGLLALVPALAIAVNLGQFARNVRASGSPTGPSSPDADGKERLLVADPTPAVMAANAVRHLSLHFATPSWKVNAALTSGLRKIIRAMGVDPDDPGSTWHEFRLRAPNHSEYFTGSPLHLLLFAAVLLAMARRPRRWSGAQLGFAAGTAVSLLMFICLFPWSVWSARLHVMSLLFACAPIALVFEGRRPAALAAILVVGGLMSLGDVAWNATRPLLPRAEKPSIFTSDRWSQYFADKRNYERPFTTFIEDIRRDECRDVGFDASVREGDIFEYPLLRGLGVAEGLTRVWNVGVTNRTANMIGELERRTPCAVVCLACGKHPEKLARYSAELPCRKTIDDVVLFLRAPMPDDSGATGPGENRCRAM